jgi:hypothetical protein
MTDCFGISPTDAERLIKAGMAGRLKIPARNDSAAAAQIFDAGIAHAFTQVVDYQIRKTRIRTEDELAAAFQRMEEVREQMPTATRKALKEFSKMLPRRGGPGRQPKLNRSEASKACDHIAMFMRHGNTLKEALVRMAESSPTLVGKKVGARTLQKAWDNRDKDMKK